MSSLPTSPPAPTTVRTAAPTPSRFWRHPASWAVVAVVAFLVLAVAQAVVAPTDFAARFGTPLSDPDDTAFVRVYAARTALLTAFVVVMLWQRQAAVLRVLVWLAVGLPLVDAALAVSHGAPASTVVRHLVVGVVLVVTAVLLGRVSRRAA